LALLGRIGGAAEHEVKRGGMDGGMQVHKIISRDLGIAALAKARARLRRTALPICLTILCR
jgi:hypothetical protein